ncbi:acyl-CoA thioesterase/bile acid-CoA:amino acid N-acyltransferase family protein [Pseudalkalibacillus caeni]|uniref:Acyl-CoA thioesterase n=1 Tax=Exobacillus caeni TaxID=2574798 RepID=A0A5R9EYT9_9BACL|nr:acyl-CoA thioesterase/bile acid-CoA:amino acid N-acyltransferase family protein [Pseudalkalibacillus caeni]TLS36462.1 hypothetical protein FCL54_14660 [Pseudalkalibacillus caeni]
MSEAKIVVSSLTTMIDQPIDVYVTGLEPNQKITLRAKRIAEGMKAVHLESTAKFIADTNGVVDLNSQKPVEGSYDCIDKMGLFWSLDITKVEELKGKKDSTAGQVLAPQELTITLDVEGKPIDEITLTRQWISPLYNRQPVRNNGLVGTFFARKDKKSQPAIIVLGGSEGGLNEYPAAVLASHGFSVLALAYFGIEHLPKRLESIPLEYVEKAIDWLIERPEVNKEWIGIHGTSRGSELALLSASQFPEIKAVTSLNGSAVALSGIVPWSDAEKLPPAWTFNGKPIPYASPKNPVSIALECRELWQKRQGNPYGKWYAALTSDPEVVEQATIPVEKINGPVLFISGEEDGANTVGLSQKGIDRLKKHNVNIEYNHLVYPGAGHSIGIPYLRANTYNQGNKQDTARASVDSWGKTIRHFKQSVENPR